MKELTNRIDLLLSQKNCVLIAIDGSCAAGKTTLAQSLAELYACNVFHMDDFFLRPEQRTVERFAEIGGNVDYERFKEEILLPLRSGKVFSYRPFSCSTFTLSEPITVMPQRLNIIEGSYSHHPYFHEPYDLKIFLTVSPELRQKRIMERPSFLHKRFFDEWIPMEERYFEGFSICEKSELVYHSTCEAFLSCQSTSPNQ